MTLVLAALVFWLAMWWLNQFLVSIDTGTNTGLQRSINLLVFAVCCTVRRALSAALCPRKLMQSTLPCFNQANGIMA